CEVGGAKKTVDGWILPLVEATRVQNARHDIANDQQCFYSGVETILPSQLSPYTANVHGVLLVRDRCDDQFPSNLVPTLTAIRSLQLLSIHISLRVPILLTSPSSCGKSLLLSHLAKILYPKAQNQIITIHFADTSLDPRSLLGSYISSPTQPGTFEWKDGTLVRAMKQGKWVVLEDIDRGSSEVLGVIKPLAKSLRVDKWIGGCGVIDVPGHGRVAAAHDFALFATRSVSPSKNGEFPPAAFFGAHKFHEVQIPAPTADELQLIIDTRFPRLAGALAKSLIHLWHAVIALGSTASVRDIGMRELEKYCQRVSDLLPSSFVPVPASDLVSLESMFPNSSLREDMYAEARDVFFGSGCISAMARTHLDAIASVIAQHLGLDSERQRWVLNGVSPYFDAEKDANGFVVAVHAGRTRLPARVSKHTMDTPPSRPFALHKPAVSLLSRIATAVSLSEPILLTGETGTGKTSVISYLAALLRRPLISLNLSHQTESADLLGGFKPIDARMPASSLYARFLDLFGSTFSRKKEKNIQFEEFVRKAVTEENWKRCAALWGEAIRLAKERISKVQEEIANNPEAPRKRRKLAGDELNQWTSFADDVAQFEMQYVTSQGRFAFGFVEGPLVTAIKNGEWVLLDEVNLASPETLECIAGLLHGPTSSITLTEQGALEPVPRHPDFRLFACMNPATDVGKKDLPPNIRARFTEFDVPAPDADRETLLAIVNQYIGHAAVGDKAAVMNIAEFYIAVKQLAEAGQIADGANHRPHFSMRTLARALTFAADITRVYGLRRAIWEGCLMAFTMVLDAPSAQTVVGLAHKHLLAGVRNPRSLLTNEPSDVEYTRSDRYVKFGPFYLEKGPFPEDPMEEYIMTPSVETKLIDLARIILTRRFPVLIEGPTSSGKTSSVEYLARRTGHRFIRINNHEHTDIQEYLGSYVSDPVTGKFVFKDGLLVQALRHGDWIVLDELNLAPTDVLEALNRLLDDNRELIIPETHEVVKPHPHFMLFAAQNPPGLYGGRKVLSRAFRNRFLEVHYEDVPQAELETILCQRCKIAPSYGRKIVAVFRELQKKRQGSRVFDSKEGFATLRDLFRWAGRDAVGYQELAENGYMLLAERARQDDEKTVVKEVIESVMGVKIDEKAMYQFDRMDRDIVSYLGCPLPDPSQIIWTSAMQRMFILIARALRFNEPVLLVGETGSGKTSICQLYADTLSRELHTLNCHQNTESSDLIGGLRPVRNRVSAEADVLQEVALTLSDMSILPEPLTRDSLLSRIDDVLSPGNALDTGSVAILEDARHKLLRLGQIFEWRDGPLIQAMRQGSTFLLDEISLADDSVLERLNSVLEPARTIVLAERGGDHSEPPFIKAVDNFKLVATMNPGGDYGKKELSPALRNRFTEIWVPAVDDRSDLELIVSNRWEFEVLRPFTTKVLDFTEWLGQQAGDTTLTSLRDVLAWVAFSNSIYRPVNDSGMSPNAIFHHAAQMTLLDGLGSLPQLMTYSVDAINSLRSKALAQLQNLAPIDRSVSNHLVSDTAPSMRFGPFSIPIGPNGSGSPAFNLETPTTQMNAMRVVRACQVPKPILLEGSPGVGKTTLVAALASLTGHTLCRINLSDQTDLIDLFGSDLPVEGGNPGDFAWKDAEFLRALQEGHWVLLDEMNLAPQPVLEGLNAVLDHRGTVFIPELGRSFNRHPEFRIFAAQNPLSQGGGRKGLPKSFINRFTKVYIEEHTPQDLLMVCQLLFPSCEPDTLKSMISYNTQLNVEANVKRSFARDGAPWEFNLRDILRWCSLSLSSDRHLQPIQYLRSVYLQRFRTKNDEEFALRVFEEGFSTSAARVVERRPHHSVTPTHLQIGQFHHARNNLLPHRRPGQFLHPHLSILETLGHCIRHNWLAILSGPQECGKSEVVKVLATYTGNVLYELSFSSATDTMDILGSFEQLDDEASVRVLLDSVANTLRVQTRSRVGSTESYVLCYQRIKEIIASLRTNDAMSSLQQTVSLLDQIPSDDRIHNHKHALLELLQKRISSLTSAGQFVWVDGPLIRAAKEGRWLLIEGANLCNPSVLDRLNSLCEPNGELVLSERGFVNGAVQIIKPHPNFRLFMSVDPQFGELSRAMRNRGVEINVPSIDRDCTEIIQDHKRLPRFGVTTGRFKEQCLSFDMMRRGLLLPSCLDLSPQYRSGIVLDHHSSLAALKDPLSINQSTHSNCYENVLDFRAETHSPVHDRHISRILRTMEPQGLCDISLLRSLHRPRLNAYVRDIRQLYIDTWGVPSSLASFQRLDILLNTSVLDAPKTTASITSLLFHGLEICVRLFQLGVAKQHKVVIDSNSSILSEVDEAVSTVTSAGHEFMEYVDQGYDADAPDDTQAMEELLRHAIRLRKITKQSFFDHSAAQATVTWMMKVLLDRSPRFQALSEVIRNLNEKLSPSSGLGIMEIWSSLLDTIPDVGMVNSAAELAALASRLGAEHKDLRRETFNLVALCSIRKDHHDSSLVETVSKFKDHLLERVNEDVSAQMDHPDTSTLISELRFQCTWPHDRVLNDIGKLIQLQFSSRSQPPDRYIRYQHLIWTAETDNSTLPVLARLRVDWRQQIWNVVPPQGTPQGPTFLLIPSLLASTFGLCYWESFSIGSFTDYKFRLDSELQLLLMTFDDHPSRLPQIREALYVELVLMCLCFAGSYAVETLKEVQEIMTASKPVDPRRLVDLLGQTKSQVLGQALKLFIHPAFSEIELLSSDQTSQDVLATLGTSWIAIGRMTLHLFVPDVPLDPAGIHEFTARSWREDLDNIAQQVSLHKKLEAITTGNRTNACIDILTKRGSRASQGLATVRNYPIRSDATQITIFWSEVSQFYHQVLSAAKLDPLIRGIRSGNSGALDAENVIQQSIAGFSQRLESAYPEHGDLTLALRMAFGNVRLGLRLVSHSSMKIATDSRLDTLSSALVTFPTARAAATIIASTSERKAIGLNSFQQVLINLAALSYESNLGINIKFSLECLRDSCSQALQLWLIDRAREEEAERTSQSLYRSKLEVHEATTEATAEEEEFLALFPSFEDAFTQTSTPSNSVSPTVHVTPGDAHQFVNLFETVVCPAALAHASLEAFDSVRLPALNDLLHSQLHALSENMDHDSRVLRLRILHERGKLNSASPKTYNFYVDPNTSEVSRATAVVRSLQQRVQALRREWPEQVVLQDLDARCGLLLELHLQSPVAKILSALEQLLIQSEDWEAYASRDTSLKTHQQAITALVVEWRRMELASWQALLEAEAAASSKSSAVWWFRLYNALIRGTDDIATRVTSECEEPLLTYLRDLIPLLEDFLRSAPLGQFQSRMQLLRGFRTLASQLASASDETHQAAFERVSRILYHVENYFGLYAQSLGDGIVSQRANLEKEIKDLIKLASWKDVNIHALKESARRSHYQLFKLVRKFREILRQPIGDRLVPIMASALGMEDGAILPLELSVLPNPAFASFDASALPHLRNLDRTFAKFRDLLQGKILPRITSRAASPVNDFATEIITTSARLASTQLPPPDKSDKRLRFQKALLVRKRKAWSDLLKELKRAGFSSAVRADVLQNHSDILWIRNQPVFPAVIPATNDCEKYFWRLSSCLPELRKSLSNHHGDVSTRDLQRSLMLVESGFSLALETRERLVNACSSFELLKHVLRRLQMLKGCPSIENYGSSISGIIVAWQSHLLRVHSALVEMMDALNMVQGLDAASDAVSSVVSDSRHLADSTKDHCRRVALVVEAVQSTPVPVLLEDEAKLLSDVSNHILSVRDTLVKWSTEHPNLFHIFHAMSEWLDSQRIPPLPPMPISPRSVTTTDNVIDSLLIVVQDILSNSPQEVDQEKEDMERYILDDIISTQALSSLLDIAGMTERLSACLVSFASHDRDDVLTDLDRLLPFLNLYADITEIQLKSHSQWLRSLLKLDYVVCSVTHTIATQGFCKPPDSEESGDGGESSQVQGGVGMGEGTGTENVSKEIDEEHQVEGLQGDESNDAEQRDTSDDPNAIEMSEDIGGEMEDVPDTGSQDGDEGSDGDDSKEELDEQIGQLDKSDPSAVDEKLWGDEEGPDSNQDDDKINEDRAQNASSESEVVAKEGSQGKHDAASKDEEQTKSEEPNDSQKEDVPEHDDVDDDQARGEPPGVEGAPMDDFIQDANTLDLPDDINMGPEEIDEDGMDIDDENVNDMPNPADDTLVDEEQAATEALEANETNEAKDPQDTNMDDPAREDASQSEPDGEEDLSKEDEAQDNQAIAAADVSSGDGYANEEESHAVNKGDASSSQQTGRGKGGIGRDDVQQDQAAPLDREASGIDQDSLEANEAQVAGDAPSGSQQGPAPSQSHPGHEKDFPNPLRSLSDALEEIHRRLGPILEGSESDAPMPKPGSSSETKQIEYVRPGEEDHDMDALGPAGEEQVAQLDKLKLIDDDQGDGDGDGEHTMDVDVDIVLSEEEPNLQDSQAFDSAQETSMAPGVGVESAIVNPSKKFGQGGPSGSPDNTDADTETQREEPPDVEAKLREWQSLGQPDEAAPQLWRLYEGLTSDLSNTLCEQLRLILEPTLATRLKGDYRTGKRLNMKKVIPYIASDYTKDKIWLRRTRPSQREFQILLALDDSRSMAESHSVHLAFQTLALVSKALTRLEAGDIGVARFGETFDLLHGFSEQGPFNDQTGSRVISSFKFDQKSTNVLSLLERSLQALEQARERRSSSAADLWQLEIIVSDGICQDHEQLRNVLRKATEQKVMVVFIIIDSLHPPATQSRARDGTEQTAVHSIMSMEKVAFKSVDGRMELQREMYLDSFPFEYYVVLRNVEALPDVLSSTLKQFFERISGQ
ncbi:Midasin, partial [Pleurotus pulmonarius]